MYGRLRLVVASAALAAACALFAAPAQGFFVSDITSWSLNESWKTYGGGTQFHISQTGNGNAEFRWTSSSLTKATVISANYCSDYSLRGSTTIQGGDTTYHTLFGGGVIGECFVVRGRTNSGTTNAHDGRLRR